MTRILIVEDEDIIRNSLRKLLERKGYEVSDSHAIQDAQTLRAMVRQALR